MKKYYQPYKALKFSHYVMLYAAEIWMLKQYDEMTFEVFERKILRKNYGPTRVNISISSKSPK